MAPAKGSRKTPRGAGTRRQAHPKGTHRTNARNAKKQNHTLMAALSLHRHREEKDRYPYNAANKFAAQYRDGRWLHFASNLPKTVVDSLSKDDKEGSKGSGEKVKMDELMKESKKYEEKQKKRKGLKAPSVNEVRKHIQHMVNFSTSHFEAEFKSAYPLLAKGGKVLEESDSEGEEGDKGKNKRGTVDTVKNARKVHESLIRDNPNIPMHRK